MKACELSRTKAGEAQEYNFPCKRHANYNVFKLSTIRDSLNHKAWIMLVERNVQNRY